MIEVTGIERFRLDLDNVVEVGGGSVLLGVTGSIAAYKAVELARGLSKDGFRVQVALTAGAVRFVTPLTFETLTGRSVLTDVWSMSGEEIGHVEHAYALDLVLIAPATAHALARLAAGMADDALTSIVLSTKAPVWVAPAMESNMWRHPATQRNMRTLRDRGVRVLEPGVGELASGRDGVGRLADPARIASEVVAFFSRGASLRGCRVVLTAGPTWEAIDPVRILTSRSTGAMGIALAEEAVRRGASVHLVLGPAACPAPVGVETERVESAREMLEATLRHVETADVFIAAAAVSDFAPADPGVHKLKRCDPRSRVLALTENPDILATASDRLRATRPHAVVVGFAAETENLIAHARDKLTRKGCDLLVANRVGPRAGFGLQSTTVQVFDAQGGVVEHGPASKASVANFVLDRVASLMNRGPGE